MDWIDYREKLKIGFCDNEKLKYFFIKIFNDLEGLSHGSDFGSLDWEEYCAFCDMTGSKIESYITDNYKNRDRYFYCRGILQEHTTSWLEFIAYYVALINSVKVKKTGNCKKIAFLTILKKALDDCHLPYDLIQDGEEYFVFPKGVVQFDDALVSAPLAWLHTYPNTQKSYVKALKAYADANGKAASETADMFRKALETFFQDFFKGNKSLENYKNTYGEYLKSKGVPKEISGNLETLLQAYTNFMNNYAKHRDATSEKILEYLMYQTGNIIRLIISI